MSGLLPTEMNVAEYDFQSAFEYETQPDFTYKWNTSKNTVSGYVDGIDAYAQAVYKLLNTERYKYLIYSYNYGIELEYLFGQPIPLVIPELERVITEAVMQDDRTESVSDFKFELPKPRTVHVSFVANSIYGNVTIQKTVEI